MYQKTENFVTIAVRISVLIVNIVPGMKGQASGPLKESWELREIKKRTVSRS
jgi:hypothetical protein